MNAWLTDTLIYTGLLIGLVLVLRRPVARIFGAQFAYALWALPLVRFIMPPITLPASFAPQPEHEWYGAGLVPGEFMPVESAPVEATPIMLPAGETIVAPQPVVEASILPDWSLAEIGFSIWLGGVLAFLCWRAWTYFQMREMLLEDSRPVGEAGQVRLVETPAIAAPVAFGVFDKVVALPMNFMALENRAARDFAIEHELAHHRGGDLLANILAQPVLALHWFNPLAWMGWRAMRRDQEAACDARVVASRCPAERAAYGEVIASFAVGPRLALAAPMACPVLGEKSIIHRLRSLTMSDLSPRRRLAGRLLMTGAVLALPLTASVSYADAQEWDAPEAPEAPQAPEAPAAPEAPEAPHAPVVHHFSWTEDGEDGEKRVFVVRDTRHGDGNVVVTPDRKVHRYVVDIDHEKLTEKQKAKIKEMREKLESRDWKQFNKDMEAFSKEMAEHSEEMAKLGEEMGEKFGKEWEQKFEFEWKDHEGQAFPQALAFSGGPNFTMSRADCGESGKPTEKTVETANGKQVRTFVLCRPHQAYSAARTALSRAREHVAHDPSLSDEVRNEVLESLDREIKRVDEEAKSED